METDQTRLSGGLGSAICRSPKPQGSHTGSGPAMGSVPTLGPGTRGQSIHAMQAPLRESPEPRFWPQRVHPRR